MTINPIDEELTRESIFIIGHVLSVNGRIITINVNKNKNHSHIIYKGSVVKNISVGSYIKIIKGFIEIIGKIEDESVFNEKYFNKEYNNEEIKINRILKVSLFGHFEGDKFKQGIKEMPLVGNECYLLDEIEYNKLHQSYTKGTKTITIGSLTDEPSQKIKLSVNKLFASHIGIFGNTGSGKSNTLAKIYTELFCKYDSVKFNLNSKFIIIDFNGEYTGKSIITDKKDVYKLSTRTDKTSTAKYPISKKDIRNIEILSVLLEATEKTQKPFLNRALNSLNSTDGKEFSKFIVTKINKILENIVDNSDPFFGVNIFLDIFNYINNYVTKTDDVKYAITFLHNNFGWHTRDKCFIFTDQDGKKIYSNTNKQIIINTLQKLTSNIKFNEDEFSKLELSIITMYYSEIIKGFSNPKHILPLIGRMIKKFNTLKKLISIEDSLLCSDDINKNNLIVISFRDVNIEMKKVIPLLICKQLYDIKKQSMNKNESLHIIVDEAHNILSTVSQRESESWKDYRLETFEEIIKEGRKFGVFLTISSQRPYDISSTIISQLHNYFIHRLINENDIQAISKTVSYLDKLSFQTIPILSVGSCFVAGLASDIPIKVDISPLSKDKQPESETIDLERAWEIKSGSSN